MWYTMSDQDLEIIRQRKLLEMKRQLEKKMETGKRQDERKINANDVLNRFLVGRAWEVLHAARLQHPQAAKEVENALLKLIQGGSMRDKVTGEELYALFYRLGFRVRLETQIRVLEHGKLKSLEEKIRERTSEEG